jgi:serine/threonine protein kinase
VTGNRDHSSSEPNSVPFRVPQRFKRFRIVELIGAGGGGEVWKARDDFGNVIAFKLLRGYSHVSREQARRFMREGQILAQLQHRGICRVYDVGRSDGVLYIAMEHVDGISLDRLISFVSDPVSSATLKLNDLQTENLSQLIDTIDLYEAENRETAASPARRPPQSPGALTRILPLQQCLAIVMKVCAAIQHAHERGVLHRDIKPSNIIVRRDGEPIIVDFGIAKKRTKEVGPLTITGDVFGTMDYMAPEQARSSRDVDERSDVYSIGAILYQMVTGHRHFLPSGNLYRDIRELSDLQPTRPRVYAREVDHDLEAVILKSLTPDPAERYRSTGQLLSDLQRFQSGEPVSAKRPTLFYVLSKKISKHRTPVFFSTILLVLGLAFAGYFAWNHLLQWGRWVQVYRWTPESRSPVDREFDFLRLDMKPARPWQVDSIGMKVQRYKTAWLRDIKVPGDVRVEVEIAYDDLPDGFELMINAARDTLDHWTYVPRGYSCQYAGYRGTASSISRQSLAGEASHTIMRVHPLEPDRHVRLVFEREADSLRLHVDGKRLLAYRDHEPLHGEELSRIGFRCYRTGVRILSLSVYCRALPEKASPLIAGDALVQVGAIRKAIGRYLTVAQAHAGKKPGRDALVRAGQAALQLPPKEREEKLQDLDDIVRRHYQSTEVAAALEEIQTLALWKAERLEEAAESLRRLYRVHPGSRLITHVLDQVSDSALGYAVPLLSEAVHLPTLRLSWRDVSYLSHVDNCNTMALSCAGNNISQLLPLAGMKHLSWLDCSHNAVTEVMALSEKPLVYLDARNNRIARADPLIGLPLRYLSLARNRLNELPRLDNPKLRVLDVSSNQIADLSAIRSLQLHTLRIDRNRVRDLTPLESMPLKELSCNANRIESLDALANLQLDQLDCMNNNIRSLDPLADNPPQVLFCSGNPLRSLGGLINNPPGVFHFYSDSLPTEELTRAVRIWGGAAMASHHATTAKAYLLHRRGQWEQLRELATDFAENRYLFVPLYMTFQEATEFARKAGGELFVPERRSEWDFARRLIEKDVWLGVLPDARGWRRISGALWNDGVRQNELSVEPWQRIVCSDMGTRIVGRNGKHAVLIEWSQSSPASGRSAQKDERQVTTGRQ